MKKYKETKTVSMNKPNIYYAEEMSSESKLEIIKLIIQQNGDILEHIIGQTVLWSNTKILDRK